jgi:hypothetical protein
MSLNMSRPSANFLGECAVSEPRRLSSLSLAARQSVLSDGPRPLKRQGRFHPQPRGFEQGCPQTLILGFCGLFGAFKCKLPKLFG